MKRGDWVIVRDFPTIPGIVIRVARDGSWADVEFPSWSKRLATDVLEIQEKPKASVARSGGA